MNVGAGHTDALIKGPKEDDFIPRDYQRQMKEICLKKNTIVYLPTGAGKTHIALMVIKEMGRDLEKPLTEGGKRSFFIVNTVALAKQQAEFIGRNVPYATSIYTSDRNVDAWKQDMWLAEFAKYQIVVCTCQILLDVLKHGYLSVKHINLIVFDECHHGVGDHPMHGVMEQFLRVPKSEHPRVVGLSGMLLYKELKMVDQVAQHLERLENTFNATIATVGSFDEYTKVCTFSTNPQEILLPYNASSASTTLTMLKKMIDNHSVTVESYYLPKYAQQNKSLKRDLPKPKKQIIKLFNELKFHMDDMGLFGGSIALLGLIVQFELDKRSSDSSALRLLYRSCITFCESLRHQIEKLMTGLDMKQKLMRFSSIKIRQLIAHLEKIYDEQHDVNLKTLIFVERRFTAKVLYHVMKIYFSYTDNAELIIPDFMVGCNGAMPESIDQILNAQKDRKVLDRFKKNETNVIITTRVLEEGIDLQMCNAVIKYNHPQTFASYEQSKGRARMKNSVYVVMLENATKDAFMNKYRLYKAIETELQKCLIGKTINRPEPLESDVHKELYNELIPPFYTPKGAKLDALSSIQLLNRYCMGMPRDAFTNTNVSWERRDLNNGHIIVDVLLPLQSTVREKISGCPMPNVKMAKRSAAFNACRKLYEQGELNDHLIPIDSKNKLENLSEVYFGHWKEHSSDPPKIAGTQKCVRSHSICYPQETTNCCPQPKRPCYIYILRVTAGFVEDLDDDNVNICKMLYNSENNFGIMTIKPIPALAKMKCFVTLGLINVHLEETPIILSHAGSEEELEYLRNFHVLVFRDMLKLWKQFLVYDYTNEANSFLVVPLKNSQTIDWDLVKQFQQLKEVPSELVVWARGKMSFDHSNYRHRVIIPWYKNSRDRNYVVTKVHEHMTPKSPFPNIQYSSYEDYFKKTYQQQVVKQDQFLIEVKGITTYLNLLRPGMDDDGKKARAKNRRYNEILIPELCHNYEFPADYWLKATLLPSALHRIHYLLLAEKIRMDLASAGVGCRENTIIEDLDVDYKQRGSEADIDGDSLLFEDDCDNDDEDDDDNDDFDYDKVKESLEKPQDLEALMRNQLNPLSGELQLPWAEEEEPVDIDRNWDQVSKIELDYYDSFIKKFSDMNVCEKITSQISSCYSVASRNSPEKVKAIMDTPQEVKFYIRLLHLTPNSTANISLQQKDIMKVLTTKSSGDVFDLERYEILGDAFLKFAVSVYLIKKHQDWHEGYLTAAKGKIVSNRNLVYCAMQYGLPGMMKLHVFDPKNDWQPPLSTVPPNIKRKMAELEHSTGILYRLTLSEDEIKQGAVLPENYETFITELDVKKGTPDKSPMQNYISQQAMGDKTPADGMEALLGVSVSTVGIQRTFQLLSYFKILPRSENLLTLLDSRIDGQSLKTNISSRETDLFLVSHARIERELNYTFRDRSYLLQALTHASYPTNRITGSYQQLEFLGDAVLDFLISAYIYEQNPSMSPGQITDLRSALVNNVTLACILVRSSLHLHILSESASLTDSINRFVAFQEKQKHQITDQVNLLVEETDRKMAEFIDVPKALGDVFESLIGAIFLDSGNNLEVTWKVIYGLMHGEILAFTKNTPIQLVRQLNEFQPPCKPRFSQAIVDDDTVLVKLYYNIRDQQHLAYGFGQNKDDAKRAAAKAALQVLRRHFD